MARPRGTRDFAPIETSWRRRHERQLRSVFERYAFREVQTPTFEALDLFTAKSGDGIISELYEFEDKGGRRVTLRPELTAPVMRMYHSDHAFDPKPIKWFYFGNCFRYDRPQTGRYREFWQFGCEQIGAGTPVAYAELIALAMNCLDSVGLNDTDLRLGHVGILHAAVDASVPEAHRAKVMRLIDKEATTDLEALLTELGSEHRASILALAKGELTDLDQARQQLPWIDAAPFDQVQLVLERLTDMGIKPRLHLGIARGLDYYNGIVFEIHSPALGAQSQLVGGGGYDLSAIFKAKPTPTMGFGLGFDRTLVALEAEGKAAPELTGPVAYFGALGDAALGVVTRGVAKMRAMGLTVEMDLMGRKPNQIAKAADAVGAQYLVIVGDRDLEADQVQAKNLQSGEVHTLPLAGFVDWLVENSTPAGPD